MNYCGAYWTICLKFRNLFMESVITCHDSQTWLDEFKSLTGGLSSEQPKGELSSPFLV